MKILVATGAYPPDIGGPATYSELLFREGPKRGVQVEVLSFGRVRRLPKPIRSIVYACLAIWHGKAADAILAQDAVSVGAPALAAAFLLGKPFVVRVPGDYAWEQGRQRYGVTDTLDDFQRNPYRGGTGRLRRLQRFVVNRADRVIAPSANFAEIVRGWLSDRTKVVHIYNGIDLGEIERAVADARPEARTIMTAGRLVPWKGFGMLILTMRRLPDWKLNIAGDGPERAALEKLVREQGLSGRISFLGRLERAELMRAIASAEIFAMNTSSETFSYQAVETMAAGTPLIATRVGSLPEIIADGRDGLLMSPDDADAFVAAVERLHADPGLRAGLAAAGKEKAGSFSIDSTITKLFATMAEAQTSFASGSQARIRIAKIFRYIFSGGLAAATNLFLLWLFIYPLHIHYLISTVLAFIFAFGVSFFMQKFFTFQDHGREGVHGQAAVYLAVTGVNLLINTGLMYLFVDLAHINPIISQIIVAIMLAIESYVIYGMFIFKNGREQGRSAS